MTKQDQDQAFAYGFSLYYSLPYTPMSKIKRDRGRYFAEGYKAAKNNECGYMTKEVQKATSLGLLSKI